MIIFWILIILSVSVVWALVSLKKEKNRHEINKVNEEISKNRVIFHSSSIGDSSSS